MLQSPIKPARTSVRSFEQESRLYHSVIAGTIPASRPQENVASELSIRVLAEIDSGKFHRVAVHKSMYLQDRGCAICTALVPHKGLKALKQGGEIGRAAARVPVKGALDGLCNQFRVTSRESGLRGSKVRCRDVCNSKAPVDAERESLSDSIRF